MKEVLILLGCIVLFFGLIVGIYYGGYAIKAILLPVKTTTEQIDSAGDIIEKTYDADNAVYNYEWFKTQHEKIIAIRSQIKKANQTLNEFKETHGNASNWGYSVNEEYARLLSVKSGLMMQEDNLVADYNARSKMANREIFKDGLPFNVDKILW